VEQHQRAQYGGGYLMGLGKVGHFPLKGTDPAFAAGFFAGIQLYEYTAS